MWHSLRTKILVMTSALLIGLIAAMLLYVGVQANQFVEEQIARDTDQGLIRLRAAEQQRLSGLAQTATVVGSFPALKALLDTKDMATIRDFLMSYQQQNSLDLMAVLDPSGELLARTDTDGAGRIDVPFLDSSAGQERAGIIRSGDTYYHAAAAGSDSGGALLGWVIAASRIDDGFARSVQQDLANSEIVLVAEGMLGSTLPAGRLPWTTGSQWESAAGTGEHRVLTIDGGRYSGIGGVLGSDGGNRVFAVVMQSYDRALEPYRRIQAGLLVLGLIVAAAGVLGSAFLARTVTAPVRKLTDGTREVAAGNFEYRIEAHGQDELGDLARSFNAMIQGLRERSDMQKFVSQSTVDMIQGSAEKRVSSGERVVVTIFFSDMRGFTSMSEKRPPEEVVRILNACLSLQAERVKKFKGDIDKFVGDCVVALFTGDDMELNAIRCAVEIHKAVETYNAAATEDDQVHVGVGIATGEVVLGSIGSPDRLDYTVIGSHVNLCSRLCSLAGPGEVLLAESTFSRVEGLVAAERLEPVKVKGFSEPVPVFRMSTKKS